MHPNQNCCSLCVCEKKTRSLSVLIYDYFLEENKSVKQGIGVVEDIEATYEQV